MGREHQRLFSGISGPCAGEPLVTRPDASLDLSPPKLGDQMFESLILALVLATAHVARVIVAAALNLVSIAGIVLLGVAGLQSNQQLQTGFETPILLEVGLMCCAVAAARVLMLELGDARIHRRFRRQWESTKAHAKDRRSFRVWRGFSGLSWRQLTELYDTYRELESDRDRAMNRLRQNIWGPSWTGSVPAVLCCGLSLLPLLLLAVVARWLWTKRQYWPETIFCAIPIAAMVGVTLYPSWWWSLAFIPVGYAYLLVLATATRTYFRWCAVRYNTQFGGIVESWGDSLKAVLHTEGLWGRWQVAPSWFVFGVPAALLLWTGFGLFTAMNAFVGSWLAIELTVIGAALLTAGIYVPPAVLIYHRVSAWMKRLESKPPSEFHWAIR